MIFHLVSIGVAFGGVWLTLGQNSGRLTAATFMGYGQDP